jgi:hypothetical protein
VEVDAGTIVSTTKGLTYATQDTVTVSRTRAAFAAVRATTTGAAGNTGKSTVTVINDRSQYPTDLRVTNRSSITGGTEVRSAQVIQQSDFDLVRNSLATTVTASLAAALSTKATQMTYAADGRPTLTLTSDHKVGDRVNSFKITMTGRLGATVFSDADARALMLKIFTARVPAGKQLTSDAVNITWQVQKAGPDGAVTVNATAVGYIAPTVPTTTLRDKLRGLSAAEAKRSIERAVPGSQAEIHISPVVVPFLPLNRDHITITVVVQPVGKQ